jgi:hypothetical protein
VVPPFETTVKNGPKAYNMRIVLILCAFLIFIAMRKTNLGIVIKDGKILLCMKKR